MHIESVIKRPNWIREHEYLSTNQISEYEVITGQCDRLPTGAIQRLFPVQKTMKQNMAEK